MDKGIGKVVGKLLKGKTPLMIIAGLIALATVTVGQFTFDPNLGKYRVVRVIDGDTLEITAPNLPKELGDKLSLRVRGVDTPEMNGKCDKETQKAEEAKQFVEKTLEGASTVVVLVEKWGKFGGRVIGDVLINEQRLSKILLDRGLGVSYNGRGEKHDWCK